MSRDKAVRCAEEYYRKFPWAVVQDFLHERYGDCMEDRTAAELQERLAQYGHKFASDITFT